MLEWTRHKLQKKTQAFNSLADAYDDLLYEYKETINYSELHHPENEQFPSVDTPQTVSPQDMENELRQLLEVLNLPGIELSLQSATPKSWDEMNFCYAEYSRQRPEFLKLLGNRCQDECLAIGLRKEEIQILQQGISPENFNTHLKIPLNFGGMVNINNFALVQTHPTHENLHKIIDVQLENNFLQTYRKIFIPVFPGRIYHG